MKINEAILEAVRQMRVAWEYNLDYPHAKCPSCGSDDYDITSTDYRHCYRCGCSYSEDDLNALLRIRAIMELTDKCLRLTGTAPKRLKSEDSR